MAAAPEIVEPERLNAQEFRALLARRIRRRFGMSLDDFVRAIENGELVDATATEYAMLVGARPRQV